jgi:hypothetical protein
VAHDRTGRREDRGDRAWSFRSSSLARSSFARREALSPPPARLMKKVSIDIAD